MVADSTKIGDSPSLKPMQVNLRKTLHNLNHEKNSHYADANDNNLGKLNNSVIVASDKQRGIPAANTVKRDGLHQNRKSI